MASPEQPPLPLLFLIGDTGGGHRSAATAVAQALDRLLPGRFVPVICDPLRGPDVPRLLRWFAGLYGPCIRLTPWLWWLFWRTSDSPRGLGTVRRTVMAPVYGSVARAAQACRPALIVAFHPMTADPAVRARNAIAGTLATRAPAVPVVTVITDLITAHRSWRDAAVDRLVVPSEEMAARCAGDGLPADRCLPLGLPVAAEFCQPPLSEAERKELKRELGVDGDFLVVLTGGAEGSGGLRRRAAAIVRHVEDVDVAVICGRNKALKRRVTRLARRTARRAERDKAGRGTVGPGSGGPGSGGPGPGGPGSGRAARRPEVRAGSRPGSRSLSRRLRRIVGRRSVRPASSRLAAHGFVGNMADWLRCADIVVGKAGPGTIAEATCCGAPLVLTSFVPGQEAGNAEFVTGAGAGVYAPTPRQLAGEISRLRADPDALAAMREAAIRVGRPRAAADIARFLAGLSGSPDLPKPPGQPSRDSGRGLLPTLIAD
jgi:UDP-N-acetylglucosamine:LPS N-acetylglucosamine transferase